MDPMIVKDFDSLQQRDFENGAVRDAIRTALRIFEKLHKIEEEKCVYNIHYCKAGVGFCFCKDPNSENWKDTLYTTAYYPTFEEAVEAEFKLLLKEKKENL